MGWHGQALRVVLCFRFCLAVRGSELVMTFTIHCVCLPYILSSLSALEIRTVATTGRLVTGVTRLADVQTMNSTLIAGPI